MAARPLSVMLNPSCQYGNRIVGPEGQLWYNEAVSMFRLALSVQYHLKRHEDITVCLSRPTEDAPSTLAEEMALARQTNCDLLLALHSNAPGPRHPATSGQITFYRDGDEGSLALAQKVHCHLLAATSDAYPSVMDHGVCTHWLRLAALWQSGCPSALVEVLFHTHPLERALLLDPSFQDRAGQALADGIWAFIVAERRRGECVSS